MYQKLIIIGNLGNIPDTRYTAKGDPVTSFSVATSRKYGETDETTWFRVSVWGKQAESCQKYLSKGAKVLVEGRLKSNADDNPNVYQRKDGSWAASYEIAAETVRFLSPKGDEPDATDEVPFWEDEMSEKLKPCPFCKGEFAFDFEIKKFRCDKCGATVLPDPYASTVNTRPIEDELTARIAELEEKQRWIPVGERLPEDKKHYMTVVMNCFDGSRDVYRLRYYGNGDWFSWASESNVVTHWKEEPELPEVQE